MGNSDQQHGRTNHEFAGAIGGVTAAILLTALIELLPKTTVDKFGFSIGVTVVILGLIVMVLIEHAGWKLKPADNHSNTDQ